MAHHQFTKLKQQHIMQLLSPATYSPLPSDDTRLHRRRRHLSRATTHPPVQLARHAPRHIPPLVTKSASNPICDVIDMYFSSVFPRPFHRWGLARGASSKFEPLSPRLPSVIPASPSEPTFMTCPRPTLTPACLKCPAQVLAYQASSPSANCARECRATHVCGTVTLARSKYPPEGVKSQILVLS